MASRAVRVVASPRATTSGEHGDIIVLSIENESFRCLAQMPEDVRKVQILTTIGNYFGLEPEKLSSLNDHRALNNFLDDANCPLLAAVPNHKRSVDLSNEVKGKIVRSFDVVVVVGQSDPRCAMSRSI